VFDERIDAIRDAVARPRAGRVDCAATHRRPDTRGGDRAHRLGAGVRRAGEGCRTRSPDARPRAPRETRIASALLPGVDRRADPRPGVAPLRRASSRSVASDRAGEHGLCESADRAGRGLTARPDRRVAGRPSRQRLLAWGGRAPRSRNWSVDHV